jgi:tRNA 2-thiouridine synthesizing protein D
MKFAVQVNSSPYQSQASETAYQFISAALRKGHEVVRIFFYHDGIYHGLRHTEQADEDPGVCRWKALRENHGVDLVLCVSAAQRRGLSAAERSVGEDEIADDLAAGFRIAGLGQWAEAVITADRVLTFGG